MAVYFISDTHFGHKNIHNRFREGFSSLEDHDTTICENILKTCGKRDTLYILGDVVMDKSSLHYLKSICDRVEYVRIILGNHDFELSKQNRPNIHDLISCGVSSFHGACRYKDSWLTHIPIHESEFRKRKFNIHGHNHNTMDVINNPRYINVACEFINYTPVEYTKLISNKGN